MIRSILHDYKLRQLTYSKCIHECVKINNFILDQNVISQEINKLRSDQKVLVGQHRDLEFADPLKGFDLNPMSRDEIGVLRTNLPGF